MAALRLAASRLTLLLTVLTVCGFADASYVPEEWADRPVEIRGVWMDKGSIPKTEGEIRELVRSYAKAGINLLHPEAIFNGYSMYPSSYLTQSDRWDGLDALAIIIDEAHKHGIEVHPWVWVFMVGTKNDKGPILKAHPQWAAVNKNGESLSAKRVYWLCPSHPAARRLMLRAITELAEKYPVDGIQLDYIRFEFQNPTPSCYNDSCRRKFEAEYGIDPLEIESFTEHAVEWHLWREELINSFVAEVSGELLDIRPDLMLSAAVGRDPENARMDLLQDWRHWTSNNWLDFLAPMTYTSDSWDFLSTICEGKEAIGTFTLLAPGIGLHAQEGTEAMLEQVHIARTVPMSGVTIFASAYLDSERLKALKDGPYKKPASLPFRLPVEGVRRLIASAQDRLKVSESRNAIIDTSTEVEAVADILNYVLHRSDEAMYLEPWRPDIFVPDVVQPLPSVEVPTTKTPPTIDGKLGDAVWQSAARVEIAVTELAGEVTHPAEALLAYDSKSLYVAFRCAESWPNDICAEVVEHDGPVFQDDSVEIFLAPGGEKSDYAQFAVNTIGTRYDKKGFVISWNPEWEAAVDATEDEWTVEAAIPFASLGIPPPKPGDSWRANFCRNRVLGGIEAENMCWSATYGSFHTPTRFGKIIFAGEAK